MCKELNADTVIEFCFWLQLSITGAAIWINPFVGILTIIALWPVAIMFMHLRTTLQSIKIVPKYAMYQVKAQGGAASNRPNSLAAKQCWALAKKCLCFFCSWCWSWVSCRPPSSTSWLWTEPSPVLLPSPLRPEDTVSSHSTGCSSPSPPLITLFFIHQRLWCAFAFRSVESAAFDPGDVHHHAGHTAALSATVRAATWGGARR